MDALRNTLVAEVGEDVVNNFIAFTDNEIIISKEGEPWSLYIAQYHPEEAFFIRLVDSCGKTFEVVREYAEINEVLGYCLNILGIVINY